MAGLLHKNSPLRIFFFSVLFSLTLFGVSIFELGLNVLPVLITLVVIEVTFSFENAIINAKVLTKLNQFWQTMFLTIGILIAIFGMRIVFPILIVSLASGLSWQNVLDLALNNPDEYSTQLSEAYPLIAGFGGGFLSMLGFSFFLDKNKNVHWFKRLEKFALKFSTPWMPAILSAALVGLFAILPQNEHPRDTIMAGAVGIVTFMVIHGLSDYFGKLEEKSLAKKAKNAKIGGFAGLLTFLYLEVLDASFSLDGVIGAFAITDQVILIAVGLGIGAIWVRSMTVYMVRRGTLSNYKYLEHGAHYTVLVLALTMFVSELYHIPEFIAGVIGISLIASSIINSKTKV
ncbi:DUF475 domain-containing protein [Candidatus Nomurabacteria bacterium]|jgi:hypothetical protein|nr:DUF475 domain-containing protein [Candidatus Saccharibacteria bacterium]MCB9839663.1 DUF475 domain-containing protein [Candidatus Nomurabacteria bacterium]